MYIIACLAVGLFIWMLIGYIYLAFDSDVGGWLAMVVDSRHEFPWILIMFAIFMALVLWPFWMLQKLTPVRTEQKTEPQPQPPPKVLRLNKSELPELSDEQIAGYLKQYREKYL